MNLPIVGLSFLLSSGTVSREPQLNVVLERNPNTGVRAKRKEKNGTGVCTTSSTPVGTTFASVEHLVRVGEKGAHQVGVDIGGGWRNPKGRIRKV